MSEVGDAVRELAHLVRTEEDIEGIALQVDDLWNRVQAHREATPANETDATSEVARVLIEHTRIDGIHGDCSCKHVVPLGHSFAAHQAAMLAEAGLLRDENPARDPECPCAACDPGLQLGGDNPIWFPSRMNVCPDCGDKRCPKAANHAKWQCSGSNAVGQVGVRIGDAP